VFLFNLKVYSEEGQEEDSILELLIMCSQTEFDFLMYLFCVVPTFVCACLMYRDAANG